MVSLKSLTVVAIVSGASADKKPPQEAIDMMNSRGGIFITYKDKVALWSFHSPTEAILAAIDISQNSSGASIGAGVAIGELSDADDSVDGEPVDESIALALGANPRQVLLTKGTQLSKNHNEIDCGETLFVEHPEGGGKIEAYEAFRPGTGNGVPNSAPLPKSASKAGKNGNSSKATGSQHSWMGISNQSVLLPAIIILLMLLAYGGGIHKSTRTDYLGKAEKMETLGASSYALELALSGWEEDRGNPNIEEFLTRITIAEGERYIANDRPDLATRLIKRVKRAAPFNTELDDTFYKATETVITNLLLKGRDDVATEIGSKLLMDLPHKSDEIASAIALAKVERIHIQMENYIQKVPERPDFEQLNLWRTLLNEINLAYPEWGKVYFLFARINLFSNRVSYFGSNLIRAMELEPSLAKERIILADILRACKMTYSRADSELGKIARVMSEGLDKWVEKEITPWLGESHSVIRTMGYKVLKARNALPSNEDLIFRFHLLNLNYKSSTVEKRTQVPAAILLDSLNYAGSLKDSDQIKKVVEALSSMPKEALETEEVSALRTKVLNKLTNNSANTVKEKVDDSSSNTITNQ